jgi:hypothetical protein
LIASGSHLVNKFGIIEVNRSQCDIIIKSDFSIATIAFGFASTSGSKYASLIFKFESCFGSSIFVSHLITCQSSSSACKCDSSKVDGITLHFTLNIFETCFNHLSKLQVISAIAVIIKFHKLCPQTEHHLSYL